MQYRNLGNSDLKVSRICLGTMTLEHSKLQKPKESRAEIYEQLNSALPIS